MIIAEEKFYKETLPNFESICKETHNAIINNARACYNCMSYAFDEYRYRMDIDDFFCTYYEDYEDEFDWYLHLNDNLRIAADEILNSYTNVREIANPAEAKENERVIAMRFSETDFHFARLGQDGIWTHKPGGGYIRVMSQEEFFGPEGWCYELREDPYLSEIIYFALVKDAKYWKEDEEGWL